MQLTAFTTKIRSEFLQAQAKWVGQGGQPYEKYTFTCQSTARNELYNYLSATPQFKRWRGYRQFANVDQANYLIPNLEYSGEFQVRLRDVQDDQTGGYAMLPQELVAKTQIFPNILTQATLANGDQSGFNCLDGLTYFNAAHTYGGQSGNNVGNNIISGTASTSDGVHHRMIVMVIGGQSSSMIKPIVYQVRKPATELMTDAGTPQSNMDKMIRYWTDCELGVGFGNWWDAILVNFVNTPTLADLLTTFTNVEARLRDFVFPKALPTDPDQFVHANLVMTPESTMCMSSSALAPLVRQVLAPGGGQIQLITTNTGSAVTNFYTGLMFYMPSPYLNVNSSGVPAAPPSSLN